MSEQKSLIDTALEIAVRAHEGQVDKLGAAYIGHPARVAGHARALGGSPEAIATACLHDVIEDSEVSAQDLRASGIPETVITAVELLSKRPGQSLGRVLHAGAPQCADAAGQAGRPGRQHRPGTHQPTGLRHPAAVGR